MMLVPLSLTVQGKCLKPCREQMCTIKADHLNIQRKDLKPLEIGDVVHMQPEPELHC